jgi:hypothetical protein
MCSAVKGYGLYWNMLVEAQEVAGRGLLSYCLAGYDREVSFAHDQIQNVDCPRMSRYDRLDSKNPDCDLRLIGLRYPHWARHRLKQRLSLRV